MSTTIPVDTQNIKKLRSYLNFKARVTITDGRIFIGTFVCTDKQKNIILAQTKEFRGGKKKEMKMGMTRWGGKAKNVIINNRQIDEHRMVGLVMIPGKHLVKIETEDLDDDDDNGFPIYG